MLPALLIALLALAADPAMAAPQCPAGAEPVPAELASWGATSDTIGDRSRTPLGKTVSVRLQPSQGIRWRYPPEHAPAAGSTGAHVHFDVPARGVYQVALGDALWIDMVGDRGPISSVSHGHGPACSGIRKIVAFELRPGRYDLQLSGGTGGSTRLLVTRR